MQISERTLAVLKSVSRINPSILIRPGNKIESCGISKNVAAYVQVDNTFETEAGIYDLPRFLGTLSLFDDPDVVFENKHIIIKEGSNTVRYTLTDKSMIISPPAAGISLPNVDVQFNLPIDQLNKILMASTQMKLPVICVSGQDGVLRLSATSENGGTNRSADQFDIEIGQTEKNFSVNIQAEHVKVIPDDYTVKVSFDGIVHFSTPSSDYFVAFLTS